MNTNITIEFDEAIRKSDDSEITDTSVDDHIILKETDSSGANISFDATINTAKTIITIDPTSDFSSSQTIYAAAYIVCELEKSLVGSMVIIVLAVLIVASKEIFAPLESVSLRMM